jgi:hypothetical protein
MSPKFRLCVSFQIHRCSENSRLRKQFFEACWFGDASQVRSFLESGQVTSLSVIQCGLRYALWENGHACMPVLLEAGAEIGLVERVQLGDVEWLRQRVAEGMSLKGERGDIPPLIVACSQAMKNSEVIGFLLEAGAEVDATDPWGDTALCHAVAWQAKGILRMLLDKGANVNIFSPTNAPLLQVIAEGHGSGSYLPVVVDWLLEAGADLNVRDGAGRTPMQLAILRGDPRIIRMLE